MRDLGIQLGSRDPEHDPDSAVIKSTKLSAEFNFKISFFLQPSEAPSHPPAPWKWIFPGITEPVRRCCGSGSHRRPPPLPGHQLHRSGGHVAPLYRGRGPISGPEPVHLPPDEARKAQNRRDSSQRPKQNHIKPPMRVPHEPLNNNKRRMVPGGGGRDGGHVNL